MPVEATDGGQQGPKPAANAVDADKPPDVIIPHLPAAPLGAFHRQPAMAASPAYVPPPPPPIPHAHEVQAPPPVLQPITVVKAEAPPPVAPRLGAPEGMETRAAPARHHETALVLPDLGGRPRPTAIKLCLQAEERPEPQPANPMDRLGPPSDEGVEPGYKIQLEPPGPDRVFKLDSEEAFRERLRQEGRQRPTRERIEFPEEPVVSREAYTARSFPPMTEVAEPHYLCYQRLLFEDLNSERYGWDLGFIQPVVSAGLFYWDMATLAYHVGTEPCRKYECSAGYCLPGDPVPYLIYPPELSLTGTVFEAGTIVALFAIFPG